tara:strand:- start:254 stop:367 length:114 start_codon:yes stop_codon:yes gene_type:complete
MAGFGYFSQADVVKSVLKRTLKDALGLLKRLWNQNKI